MPWLLGCTLGGQVPEGTYMHGRIPFIYKVTLVSTCSKVVYDSQPDMVTCFKLQEQSPLQVHLENAQLGG